MPDVGIPACRGHSRMARWGFSHIWNGRFLNRPYMFQGISCCDTRHLMGVDGAG